MCLTASQRVLCAPSVLPSYQHPVTAHLKPLAPVRAWPAVLMLCCAGYNTIQLAYITSFSDIESYQGNDQCDISRRAWITTKAMVWH
jgi:hypothetical protein